MLSFLSRPRPSRIDELIGRVTLFEACTAPERQFIRRLGDVAIVREGTVVADESDPNARFYAVLEGRLDVVRGGWRDNPVTAGESFGAVETLRRLRQPATLVAAERSEVFVVGPREFAGLVDEVPGVARRLLLDHVPQRTFRVVGPAKAGAATRLA